MTENDLLNTKRFRRVGAGSARTTYLDLANPRFVVKFAPLHPESNEAEYAYYRKFGKFGGMLPVARCRLLKDHRFLVMEYIEDSWSDVFHHVRAALIPPRHDGCQGGFDRKGRVVFYDYEISPEYRPAWRGPR